MGGFCASSEVDEKLERPSEPIYNRIMETPEWQMHCYSRGAQNRPNAYNVAADPMHRESFVEFPDLALVMGTISVASSSVMS